MLARENEESQGCRPLAPPARRNGSAGRWASYRRRTAESMVWHIEATVKQVRNGEERVTSISVARYSYKLALQVFLRQMEEATDGIDLDMPKEMEPPIHCAFLLVERP